MHFAGTKSSPLLLLKYKKVQLARRPSNYCTVSVGQHILNVFLLDTSIIMEKHV